MESCRICGEVDCDKDCEELARIYRDSQREKLRDIDPEEVVCDVCGHSYGERSHDTCHGWQ